MRTMPATTATAPAMGGNGIGFSPFFIGAALPGRRCSLRAKSLAAPELRFRRASVKTSRLARVLALAAVYVALGRLGQAIALQQVTAVWPPSGVAVAAALFWG